MEAIEDERTEAVTLAADVVAAITKHRNKSLKEIDEARTFKIGSYSAKRPAPRMSVQGQLATFVGDAFQVRSWGYNGRKSGEKQTSRPEGPKLSPKQTCRGHGHRSWRTSTHFCTRSWITGSFVIGRKTIKKRMLARLQAIKMELRRRWHAWRT